MLVAARAAFHQHPTWRMAHTAVTEIKQGTQQHRTHLQRRRWPRPGVGRREVSPQSSPACPAACRRLHCRHHGRAPPRAGGGHGRGCAPLPGLWPPPPPAPAPPAPPPRSDPGRAAAAARWRSPSSTAAAQTCEIMIITYEPCLMAKKLACVAASRRAYVCNERLHPCPRPPIAMYGGQLTAHRAPRPRPHLTCGT